MMCVKGGRASGTSKALPASVLVSLSFRVQSWSLDSTSQILPKFQREASLRPCAPFTHCCWSFQFFLVSSLSLSCCPFPLQGYLSGRMTRGTSW